MGLKALRSGPEGRLVQPFPGALAFEPLGLGSRVSVGEVGKGPWARSFCWTIPWALYSDARFWCLQAAARRISCRFSAQVAWPPDWRAEVSAGAIEVEFFVGKCEGRC